MHVIPVDNDIKVSRNALQGRGLETNAPIYNSSVIFLVIQTADENVGRFFNAPCRIVCAEVSAVSPASQAPVGNNWTKFNRTNIHAH